MPRDPFGSAVRIEQAGLEAPTLALLFVAEGDDRVLRKVALLRDQGIASIVVTCQQAYAADLLSTLDTYVNAGLYRKGSADEVPVPPRPASAISLDRRPERVRERATEREVKVLRLLAEGFSTAEVGRQLFLSERSVKNAVHDFTNRFDLRNRTHAVVYALRTGLI